MGLTYIKSRFLHPVKMKWYDLQIEIIGAWKFFLKRQRSGERNSLPINGQNLRKQAVYCHLYGQRIHLAWRTG